MKKKSGDWLERNHVALHQQVNSTWKHIMPLSNGVLEKFGYLTGSVILIWITTVVGKAVEAFNTAFANWLEPTERTSIKQALLIEAEKTLRPLFRQLHILFKGNPAISEADLVSMNMPRRRRAPRNSTSAPDSFPSAFAEVLGQCSLAIYFRNSGANSKGRPDGIRGVELVWVMADQKPVSYDDFRHTVLSTRSPITLNFNLCDRGRKIYFALRWENQLGVKGGWSMIGEAIVP
jgi:hypothetical protein